MRWFFRSVLLLALLGGLVLSNGMARAWAVTPAVSPNPPGLGGRTAAPGPEVVPAAPLATPTPACTATADPQTCANAFVQPFNRFFQIAILVLLSLIGGGALIAGLMGIARGVGGGLFNEPRWVSRAFAAIGGVILLVVLAVVLVNAFTNINGLVPAPSLPQLGGGS